MCSDQTTTLLSSTDREKAKINQTNNLDFIQKEGDIEVEDTTVYDSEILRVAEERFTFNVIEYSHYISGESIEFSEVSSCTPIDGADVSFEISSDERHEITNEIDGYRFTTSAFSTPLDNFDESRKYDLFYKFGESAYTAIEKISRYGYATYHTYPEVDSCIVTQTNIYRL